MRRPYESMYDRLCAHCMEDAGCWTWVGPVRRCGGGYRPAVSVRIPGEKHPITEMALNPRQRNAARLMCEIFHGPPSTPEHEASHIDCEDNWLCIHPWHLFWETKRENMARMWAKRRADADADIDAGVRADPEHCPF